jgi:UDP-2,3-diacylglucosamine pyrophosphatase LpxH
VLINITTSVTNVLDDTDYGNPEVRINSGGKDVVVISDLHLGSGINASNNYDGTENFFADDSFARFLTSLQKGANEKKQLLIINGDFIDFLRIRDIPETDNDFVEWSKMLQLIGLQKTVQELKASITDKEIEYGLKTHDFKSVWKLHKCSIGHAPVFRQLGQWLQDGNTLIITKGNHDLEWYWAAVRQYLRYLLVSFIPANQNKTFTNDIQKTANQNILFADDALIIDGKIFIRHGHNYENFTTVRGDPTLNNNTELNLPFGSFFNRYLINQLELAYPFLDNIRPTQKVLPLLIRERFPLAIKVLFHYIPFVVLIIPKKMYWQVFKYLFHFLLIIIVPLAITVYAIIHSGTLEVFKAANNSSIIQKILAVLQNFIFLFLSYVFGRLMSMLQLSPPGSLLPFATNIYQSNQQLEVVSFGHTHDPEQNNNVEKWYFNTGTWMPVYDISSANVRMEKTYTYLLITQDDKGNITSKELLRWNDDALRAEAMVLQDRR